MRARRTFEQALDEIAGQVDDAEYDTRQLLRGPLPPDHRRHLEGALADLERAQDRLLRALWGEPCPPADSRGQLALSV